MKEDKASAPRVDPLQSIGSHYQNGVCKCGQDEPEKCCKTCSQPKDLKQLTPTLPPNTSYIEKSRRRQKRSKR
jgi:hypothetical protein